MQPAARGGGGSGAGSLGPCRRLRVDYNHFLIRPLIYQSSVHRCLFLFLPWQFPSLFFSSPALYIRNASFSNQTLSFYSTACQVLIPTSLNLSCIGPPVVFIFVPVHPSPFCCRTRSRFRFRIRTLLVHLVLRTTLLCQCHLVNFSLICDVILLLY